ncbi:uncharacterized protein K489DRAFT_383931 [Dissoconium aciculare CBS 342.82]|uniref:Uncharacterized protein n=1 Tax=Dissoconium aciculare CBS 342.82 TaxID=1314786 RepID=A0A6J3LUU1_9PEZI|nr:uncharacterized protein K489DRAFT_383931 [Dissoconium aciculare CBS 342.82]KAF1819039.1 hypothetical protein K489DRAFT_383931 [Dissoconium aciculare CBS 342.82]
MFNPILLTSALTVLATASPVKQKQRTTVPSNCYGIGLSLAIGAGPDGGKIYYEPAPIEMNKLTQIDAKNVEYIVFVDGSASHVPIDQVACRTFSDADGVVPLNLPFTKAYPSVFIGVEYVGSILCYVRPDYEKDNHYEENNN